jgi:hypothetical protein
VDWVLVMVGRCGPGGGDGQEDNVVPGSTVTAGWRGPGDGNGREDDAVLRRGGDGWATWTRRGSWVWQ